MFRTRLAMFSLPLAVATALVTALAAPAQGEELTKHATTEPETATSGDATPGPDLQHVALRGADAAAPAPAPTPTPTPAAALVAAPEVAADAAAGEPKAYVLALAVVAAIAFVVRRRG